jgi:chromatin remodeling complex protein RSC6
MPVAKTSVKTATPAPSTTKASKKVVDQAAVGLSAAPVKSEKKAVEKAEKPKKSVKKAATAPVVEAPAAAEASSAATATEPVVTEVAASTEPAAAAADEEAKTQPSVAGDNISSRFNTLLEKLTAMATETRELTTLVRNLQKEHAKFVRDNHRNIAKRQNKPKRVASGFAKPTLLSDEMYEFLSIPKGDVVVRNDVTRKLNQYVVSNNLRDEKDKRRIMPDAPLKKLLNIGDGEQLTYFNIQKYIKHHFLKPETTTAA